MTQLDALNFMQNFVVVPMYTEVRFGQWDTILAQHATARTAALSHRHLAFRARHGAGAQGQRWPKRSRNSRRCDAIADGSGDGRSLLLGTTNYAGDLLDGRAPACCAAKCCVAQGKHDEAHRVAARGRDDRGRAQLQRTGRLAAAGAATTSATRCLKAKRAEGSGDGVSRTTCAKFPKNGWGLYGLAQAQDAMGEKRGRGRNAQADSQAAWQWARYGAARAAVF